ncbi:hypothetical protein Pla52o_11160 [Novipirellula galeiformis]|uniref:Uncharacterized protein n=1 Tax=Novipirellula galeiformis TaxID=2528004 RepID=A0A5C6CP42_9BACT|nr:hypothetical protein [Novipirellula galeiformis]TWU24826.1 hypothetical protein Pla52o_11160 [Novipirellula galeiformis]
MKSTRLLALLSIAFAAIGSANAQDQSAVPDGSASQISDWALAGVIWSDASLTKKLARQAAEEADSPEQAEQFRKLFQQSSRIVEAMETFGWKQVKQTGNVNGDRSLEPTGSKSSLPELQSTPARNDVSSDEAVGAALARPTNLSTADADSSKRRERPKSQTAPTPTLDSRIERFDTETPAGQDDPGMDDERSGSGLSLDVDNYRVDDYIDETPAEARNRADAIEDGVEGAIAAASGRLGIGTRGTDHISYRETQTRSATLPYAEDSIYDSDDYDPDADYDVNNPLGANSINPASVNRGDNDDDIDRGDPAQVIDGEDELLAAMAREQQATREPTTSAAATPRRPTRTDLNRYTAERSKYIQDANWVQFHLDANQAVWTKFTTRENLNRRLSDSLVKLRADVSVALEATDNELLKSILIQVQ